MHVRNINETPNTKFNRGNFDGASYGFLGAGRVPFALGALAPWFRVWPGGRNPVQQGTRVTPPISIDGTLNFGHGDAYRHSRGGFQANRIQIMDGQSKRSLCPVHNTKWIWRPHPWARDSLLRSHICQRAGSCLPRACFFGYEATCSPWRSGQC